MALQDVDVLDTTMFQELYPSTMVRDSHLEFIWGEDGATAESVEVFLSVYRGEQSNSFSLKIENLTVQEQSELKQAIQDWHCTGKIRFGRLCCTPCWE